MNNIASERVRIGLDQKELASKIGASPSSIARWEQGKTEPPASFLIAMSNVFSCSIDYLLGISEERVPYGKKAS